MANKVRIGSADKASFAEMWHAKVSRDVIAAHFKIAPGTVTRTASRFGLPPRSEGDSRAPRSDAGGRIKRAVRKDVPCRVSYAAVQALVDAKGLTFRQALCQLHRQS